MPKCIGIERLELRPGRTELDKAYFGPKGYELAAPHFSSKERKRKINTEYVDTLDKAAELIERQGYHIRMGNPPEKKSLIEPSKVRILRA
jgi:hypothetical protein